MKQPSQLQDKNIPQPKKLRGGELKLWLNVHRETIIDYHQEFGEYATLSAFNLFPGTLKNLLNNPPPKKRTFSKVDRALTKIEITDANVASLRREIRELKKQFESFQDDIGSQLVEKFFLPLMQAGLKPNDKQQGGLGMRSESKLKSVLPE